jgi:hypothetical protein
VYRICPTGSRKKDLFDQIVFVPILDGQKNKTKELQTNTMGILHLIFRPSLTELQSPNPQRGPATSAVWLNQFYQI